MINTPMRENVKLKSVMNGMAMKMLPKAITGTARNKPLKSISTKKISKNIRMKMKAARNYTTKIMKLNNGIRNIS